MGGFAAATPLALPLMSIGLGFNDDRMAVQHAKRGHSIANQLAESKAGAEKAILETKQIAAERDRENRLRRAVATQRARYGAGGVGGKGGSAAALYDGLRNQTDRSLQDDRKLLAHRLGLIDAELEATRKRGLLDVDKARHRRDSNLFKRGLSSLLEF